MWAAFHQHRSPRRADQDARRATAHDLAPDGVAPVPVVIAAAGGGLNSSTSSTKAKALGLALALALAGILLGTLRTRIPRPAEDAQA